MVTTIRSLGRRSVGIPEDVSSAAEVDTLVATVVSELGRLDTMVANAGIADVKPLLETTEDERKRMIDVNVHGVFNCYISAARQMVKQGGGGRILGAFHRRIQHFPPPWDVLDFEMGGQGFTQVAAKEWAYKYGICVNAFAPGIVDTPMWDLIDEKLGKELGLAKGEARKKHADDLVLLGRLSVPSDVAKLVSFLASADSEYITGKCMIVDGGVSFA